MTLVLLLLWWVVMFRWLLTVDLEVPCVRRHTVISLNSISVHMTTVLGNRV